MTSAACLAEHPDALEEGVTEDAIGPSGAAEIAHTSVEPPRCRQPGGNRGVSNAFNHRDEGLFSEVLDQVWPTRIHVHQAIAGGSMVDCRSKRLQILDEIRFLIRSQIEAKQPVVVIHDGKQVSRTPVMEIGSMLQEPA